ncbi:MAG: hypothetical protein ABSF54_09150 [Bryobacteraceae bacterium]|jgi:hypothetical protein
MMASRPGMSGTRRSPALTATRAVPRRYTDRMKPAKLLQLRHFDAFHCIGADCEDTCCVGWFVHVDKPTYEKYQNYTDPDFGPPLHTLVTINEKVQMTTIMP